MTTSALLQSTPTPIWKIDVAEFDGLGEKIWDDVTSGLQGTIYTNTVYDGQGQVLGISNPSYSSTGLVYTTYEYDALGRKTSTAYPDGSSRQWCYDGVASEGQTNCLAASKATETSPVNISAFPWIDISDEDGHHSQQISDGLGRLAAVIEPSASNVPALETDYQYDALGNLSQVDQWGGANGSAGDRERVFAYDGLSRLTAAYNPESGTTTYAYLANGTACSGDPSLPCSRTDARGTTVNFTYDALNRLTSKYYSGGFQQHTAVLLSV